MLSFRCAILTMVAVLGVGIDPLLAQLDAGAKESRTYCVTLPEFDVEFDVPPQLVAGFGPGLTKLTFDDLEENPRYFLKIGPSAHLRRFATYYQDVIGSFKDWKLTVSFSIMRFSNAGFSAGSIQELERYITADFSTMLVLKEGSEATNFSGAAVERAGGRDMVVVRSVELYRATKINLKDGGVTRFAPYQVYFVPLDDRTVFVMYMNHQAGKHLTPEWHEAARDMALSVVGSLKIVPRSR